MAGNEQVVDFVITAQNRAAQAFNEIKRSLNDIAGVSKTVGIALGALGAGLSVGAFAAGLKSIIDQADELGKLSQKVGVTVENLSTLRYAAELSNVSMESFEKGLKKLSSTMFDAATGSKEAQTIFSGLNVAFESTPGKLKPTDDVLLAIADRFKGLEDGAAKSALAVKLFGKTGLDLIPFLNQGRDGVRRLKEELEKLGGVFTGEMAQKAEEFNDNLKALGVASNKLKIEIVGSALPALKDITDAMREAAKETGTLMALWVGLGGLAANAFGVTELQKTASRVKEIDDQLAVSRKQLESGSLNPKREGAGLFSFLVPDVKLGDEQVKKVKATIDSLEKERARLVKPNEIKPPKITPDVSDFSPDKSAILKPVKDTLDLGKQLAEDQAEWAKAMSEAAQATDDMNEKLRERQALEDKWGDTFPNMTAAEIKDWEKLKFGATDALEAIQDQQARIVAGFDENGNAIDKKAKESSDLARELGLTFQSAFENAVIGGKKLRDVLGGIAQDIARIVLRKGVTEPLGNALVKSDTFSGIGDFLKGLFGGGKAAGGPLDPGKWYMAGEHGPEPVWGGGPGSFATGYARGQSGGGTVNVIFGSGPPTDPQAVFAGLLPALKAVARGEARGEISTQLRPGGVLR